MSSIESLLHFIEMTNVSFCSMPLLCFSVICCLSLCVFLSFRVCMLVAVPTVMTLYEACRAHRSQNLSDLTSVLI